MLQAIVLGIVQGLTEFLPVSSSGHLVIVPYLLSWEQPPLVFDVAVHAGTLVAVVVYFWSDLWRLTTHSLGIGADAGQTGEARRIVGMLALGTIPAALAGLLVRSVFDAIQPRAVSVLLLATGAILWLAEHVRLRRLAATAAGRATAADGVTAADTAAARADAAAARGDNAAARGDNPAARAGTATVPGGSHQPDDTEIPAGHDPPPALGDDIGRDQSTVGLVDSLAIGAAQAVAILPGISRSGSTIAAGMLRGLSREAAARFSFLLSIPVIVGAVILELPDMVASSAETGGVGGAELVAGLLAAGISGYAAIRLLMRLVTTESLIGFARYVAVVGVLAFAATFVIG